MYAKEQFGPFLRSIIQSVFALLLAALIAVSVSLSAWAQTAPVDLQSVFDQHIKNIKRGSVKTIDPIIADILALESEQGTKFLETWQAKELWYVKENDQLVTVKTEDKKSFELFSVIDGGSRGEATKKQIKQIKPNSGVRAKLGGALVGARLLSSDTQVRRDALQAIKRKPEAAHLGLLRAAISKDDSDPDLANEMSILERQLTIGFAKDENERVVAITSFEGDLSIEARAALNPLLATTRLVVTREQLAESVDGKLVAREIAVGDELDRLAAYDLIAEANNLAPRVSAKDLKSALEANVTDGLSGGVPIGDLGDQSARLRAYDALAVAGKVSPLVTENAIDTAFKQHAIVEVYNEPSSKVVNAALTTLDDINRDVSVARWIDLFLDGLSLASIFFLAAIGLAITFGVMGVINMAHGEFIMMGAYTGYVTQLFITNYTVSILIALPLAFAVTFLAGVVLERLVIRHLYHRPLETLLATFGVSIALQQLAKNIFGTQARPLTAPTWLDGSWAINEVISISWIRVAIFILSLVFFFALMFVLKRTRFGLETRAVTQNPRMAASMGINPDRINMLTFGLGSGIAGIAGVAIGLFAKVTSELGSDFIVQSFMTVVVGGVGNIFGTLAGATMIGFLQKGIEWLNPSNTLAAQTYMIVFIIIFIQFRPRGLIALKGRAAGD